MTIGKAPFERIWLRGGIFFYRRRPPKAIAHLDPRKIVRVSLGTADRADAARKAAEFEEKLEQLWAALLAGEGDSAWGRYNAAVERARLEGFAYRPADVLAAGPEDEIVRRVRSLMDRPGDRSARKALLGGATQPRVMASEMVDEYARLMAAEHIGKRPEQIRRWTNARRLAVANFVAVVGDKPIGEITREDARLFQGWWADKVKAADGAGANQANKQIGQVAAMLSRIADELRIDVGAPFAGLTIREMKARRESFTREWVETKLLAPDALKGLNRDARIAFYLAVETGMGAEEICSLRPEDIHAFDEVPYVHVASRMGAEQKTAFRDRVIPLVGVSLLAAQEAPNGVERYFGRNASLSTAVNKFLRANDLLPSPRHSLYSLRHSFQDRLNDVGAPERMQADLMGHRFDREKYGRGHTLEAARMVLEGAVYRFDRVGI
jgi:integrase